MRYLLSLICCLLTVGAFSEEEDQDAFIISTPDQVAALSSEPNYLIGGLISPLSGQPVLRQTDLVVKGAQNLSLSRTYIPPYMPVAFEKHKHNKKEWDKYHLHQHIRDNYKGWQFLPHLKLRLISRSMEVHLTDPNGMTLAFHLSGPNYSTATLASPSYAITNTVGELPSGKYDPRNTRISYEDNGNKLVVHAPDGASRFYYRKGAASKRLYILEKEILPNGKVLKYTYDEKLKLISVESLDPKERYVYASIRIQEPHGSFHFLSSTGTTVDYSYQRRPIHVRIKEKAKGRETIQESNYTCRPILTSVSSPFYRYESLNYGDRFLLDSYFGKNEVFKCEHASFGEGVPHFKVHKLLLPVGQNDSFYPVHEMVYQPPVAGEKAGTTTVKNSDGTSITYHFSKNLLTTAIQYFGQDGKLKKEKIFSWSEKNWLKSIEMRDDQNNSLYKRSYEFDGFGNPISEIFVGDLTGNGAQESYTITREFSQDGRNLLLKEAHESGKVICFAYLPNSNLVTSKITKDGDRILLREFSKYDDCHNLVQNILDDGESSDESILAGVTERTITNYTLRQQAPFLHMPEWIEEKYWEGGSEKLLKKIHLIYDQHGNIAQEEVHDADGILAYIIYKQYNERGDLVTETNRLGQQATYTYDPRGRLESSLNFSQKLLKTFHHDMKGRFREKIEKGDGEIAHAFSYAYDAHDRLIQKTEPFSDTTHYTYDPLVSQITRTDSPSVTSADGQAIPVTTFATYDPFGREVTKVDANGHTTTYRYNAYGSPTEITYPDSSKEYFRYTKKGKLASHIDPDGLTIQYQNDLLDRVLSKTYISADGKTLAEEVFTYNGFNLLTETDREGNLTQYTYDGTGRKIREEFCGKITSFSYDSLGQLSILCKYNGDNTLQVHYKRDVEGRVIEESQTDISNQLLTRISYTFDEDGNRNTIVRYINGKEAINAFTYDAFHRLIEEQDALGYESKTVYQEAYTNQLGQKVLQTSTTDPRGVTTVETQDAYGRVVKKEVLNSQKAPISSAETYHDANGNLTLQKDHLFENEHYLKTQCTKYTYTNRNQIASLIRALGTPNARSTTFTYTPSGKRESKTLPDGISLTYGYHPLGYLQNLQSSDGKIQFTFLRNRLGQLLCATDEVQKSSIHRELDPCGNIIREEFPSGLTLEKTYDAFDRPLTLTLPDKGEVIYTYDPLFLRSVTRTSAGDTLYTHSYDLYDQDGNLVVESLIGNLGRVMHSTDSKGQKLSINCSYFSQQNRFDPCGNLVSSTVDATPQTYIYDDLSQLTSEKSSPSSFIYAYDSLYNRTKKNDQICETNELNELLSSGDIRCSYDRNGNQTQQQSFSKTYNFTYDPLNRLIRAENSEVTIEFAYDPLDRRLSKTVHSSSFWGKYVDVEHYLYDGQNEIGAFTSPTSVKNLRVLGLTKPHTLPSTIAIELGGQAFAPILDYQGSVRQLIDLYYKSCTASYNFTAFGEELNPKYERYFNPWRFVSKRFDPELNLIYFGKRYYDPALARWLTTDPAGFVDSINLYQYVLNNPFRYCDPDGQFLQLAVPLVIWGAEAIFPALATYVAPLIYGAVTGTIAYGGYKVVHALNQAGQNTSFNPMEKAYINRYISQQEKAAKMQRKKKGEVDAKLSDDPLNDPNLEDVSHPQAKEKGHHKFKDKRTGQIIEYDKAKPGSPGHKGHDHYHRPNPNTTGENDTYLDSKGNPVPDGSESSHLYPPEWIWWK